MYTNRIRYLLFTMLIAFMTGISSLASAGDVLVDDTFFNQVDSEGRSVFSDSRTSDYSSGTTGGIKATSPWTGGRLTFSWDISKGLASDPAAYHYVYTIDGYKKDISHVLLEVSSTFNINSDLIDLSTSSSVSLEGPKTFSKGSPSNPGMPANVYAIKFDNVNSKDLVIDFWSDRAPVWGDFYMKDGVYSSSFVYAYNRDFGKDPMLVGVSNKVLNDYLGFIPRPDTYGVTVPEPTTWMALGIGTGIATLARRRRQKKK